MPQRRQWLRGVQEFSGFGSLASQARLDRQGCDGSSWQEPAAESTTLLESRANVPKGCNPTRAQIILHSIFEQRQLLRHKDADQGKTHWKESVSTEIRLVIDFRTLPFSSLSASLRIGVGRKSFQLCYS